MTVEDLRLQKKLCGYSNQQIADMSGVPLGTVQKIFSGETVHPRYHTIKALEKAFSPETYRYPDRDSEDSMQLRDSGVVQYAAQKRYYTVEDYRRIPDDRRMELIGGEFYDMSAPTSLHQLVAGQLFAAFLSCIRDHGLSCIPFMAPADVQLHCDDTTMVQPDLFIVCDRDKILDSHIYGAPDLTVEILSASTRKKDMTLKLSHYLSAGVKEYWIVDSDRRKVIVYQLSGEMDIAIYGFEDRIPVGISEGKCAVDFSAISEYVSFLT